MNSVAVILLTLLFLLVAALVYNVVHNVFVGKTSTSGVIDNSDPDLSLDRHDKEELHRIVAGTSSRSIADFVHGANGLTPEEARELKWRKTVDALYEQADQERKSPATSPSARQWTDQRGKITVTPAPQQPTVNADKLAQSTPVLEAQVSFATVKRQARNVAAAVREAHTEWRSDPADYLLTRPLIDDVTHPLAAAWWDTWGALERSEYDNDGSRSGWENLLEKATAAQKAWKRVSDAAYGQGTSRMNHADVRKVQRAVGLLNTSLQGRGSTEAAEYIAKAQELLTEVFSSPAIAKRRVDAVLTSAAVGSGPVRKQINS